MLTDTSSINVQLTTNSRLEEFKQQELRFGRQFSDHMFVADYRDGAWTDLRITPYDRISLSPATSALHYGQSIFEGLKAYRTVNNDIQVFRYADNMKRFNVSADRMCMPPVPEAMFKEALFTLLRMDQDWVPNQPGSSLYIRPFMFATDEYVGIKPSDNYKFMIFFSPVGAYYSEPVKVLIEKHYTRAANGGTGAAKAAGNYAASLYPAKMAQEKGFHQLIWTDAKEHKYIEESGTMNVGFVIGDTLITPALSDSILAGVTRNSTLTLAREWGWKVEERQVSVQEIVDAMEAGTLKEAFGMGTAATIAQIIQIGHGDNVYDLPAVEDRELSNKVLNHLNDLRYGRTEDTHGWMTKL